MTTRKAVVDRYIEGFRRSDHDLVLSCLTADVTWQMPGVFELHGKAAFDDQIENEACEGSPSIAIDRLIEEDDAVVAIGGVRQRMKNGPTLEAVFCDVFTFVGDRIDRLETYQVTLSPPPADRPA